MTILESIKKIIDQKPDSVLGIDIGSSSIKVVQLKKSGSRAILETYGELSLGPYAGVSVGQATNLSIEKIIEALRDLLKEKEVNVTTKACGVSIPFTSSLMSIIEMPNVPHKELESMVPIEARKYIPVPFSEVTLDWSLIPKNKIESNTDTTSKSFPQKSESETVDILAVAIHNETLSNYAKIIADNQLESSFFEIEIFSVMRSVLDDFIEPMMILDLGAASSKFFIVERGVLRASHTVNRGSQNITASIAKSFGIDLDQAEIMKRQTGLLSSKDQMDIKKVVSLTLEYIFEEAKKMIVTYEKKYNKNVAKVILVGGGSALKGIDQFAKESFQTEVVQSNPFSKVVTPAFLEEVLRQTGPQFAVAVGLALRRLQEL
jgi:type IV pilus assembly protein PilM